MQYSQQELGEKIRHLKDLQKGLVKAEIDILGLNSDVQPKKAA